MNSTNTRDEEKSEAADTGDKKAQRKIVPVCDYAPEWAEHARFYREDEPCDNGRAGVPPCAEDDESCPVTDNRLTEDLESL